MKYWRFGVFVWVWDFDWGKSRRFRNGIWEVEVSKGWGFGFLFGLLCLYVLYFLGVMLVGSGVRVYILVLWSGWFRFCGSLVDVLLVVFVVGVLGRWDFREFWDLLLLWISGVISF